MTQSNLLKQIETKVRRALEPPDDARINATQPQDDVFARYASAVNTAVGGGVAPVVQRLDQHAETVETLAATLAMLSTDVRAVTERLDEQSRQAWQGSKDVEALVTRLDEQAVRLETLSDAITRESASLRAVNGSIDENGARIELLISSVESLNTSVQNAPAPRAQLSRGVLAALWLFGLLLVIIAACAIILVIPEIEDYF